VLQAPEIIASVFVRKHLRHIPGSSAGTFVDFNPCISSPGLPLSFHSLRSRYVLVLEKSVVVERDLRAGIT
jgi:hypothetical protein